MSLVSELVIACISDDEGFATEVYSHLYATLQEQRDFDEGEGLRIDRQLVRLAENEILIDNSTGIPRKMVK